MLLSFLILVTFSYLFFSEDKYTFARILVSDSLIFDSHFEVTLIHFDFHSFHNLITFSSRI